ncbi:hypothetical protein I4F81_010163 [Pyropia yezoensis]|uniref:Uncharacterized protein n=1 Tax=Pyropia yezoensis TaxID=2788 RepID=A0ACC3CCW1_PYRYE|nr:hypothetical protein I4F81_010163 [Neopyropia yezoensis]
MASDAPLPPPPPPPAPPRRGLAARLAAAAAATGLPSTVATITAAAVAAAVARAADPPVRPFFPADASLWRVPAEGIPYTHLVLVGVLAATPIAAAATVAAAAGAGAAGAARATSTRPGRQGEPWRQRRRRWVPAVRAALRVVGATLGAAAASGAVVEVVKTATGALRPDFAARCLGAAAAPPFGVGGGGGGGGGANPPSLPAVFSADADCPTLVAAVAVSADEAARVRHRLRDGRRSFPSGHASLAAAFSTAAAVALGGLSAAAAVAGGGLGGGSGGGGGSLRWAAVGEVAAVGVPAALVYGATMMGSRVADGRHHAGDVAAGAMLGAVFALVGVVPAVVAAVAGGRPWRERDDAVGRDPAAAGREDEGAVGKVGEGGGGPDGGLLLPGDV